MRKSDNHSYTNTRLAKYLSKRVLQLQVKKSQQEIAREAGFPNPNMISMLKSGKTKLPLDRVPGLAKALECDSKLLFMMAVEQLGESTTELAIRQIFGTIVSENELAWVQEIRRASENSDPHLTTRARAALWAIFTR